MFLRTKSVLEPAKSNGRSKFIFRNKSGSNTSQLETDFAIYTDQFPTPNIETVENRLFKQAGLAWFSLGSILA